MSTFKWVRSASTAVLPYLSASRSSFLSFISSFLYFFASLFYFLLSLSEPFRFLESLFFTFFPLVSVYLSLYGLPFFISFYVSFFPLYSYYLYLPLGFSFLLTASVRFAPSCFPSLFLSLCINLRFPFLLPPFFSPTLSEAATTVCTIYNYAALTLSLELFFVDPYRQKPQPDLPEGLNSGPS